MKYSYKRIIGLSVLLLLGSILLPNNFVIAQDADEGNAEVISEVPGALIQIEEEKSTASVSTITGDELYQTPTSNVGNQLKGYLLGLIGFQNSGEPGRDDATLRIRGNGTYNVQDIAIYVDGFQTDMRYVQYMSPGEIESISILKDAAALAPFGLQGANGVLWITTKTGDISSEPQVQVQTRYGYQGAANLNEPLGSYDYARLYNEARSNDAGMEWDPLYSESELQAYQSGTGINVDWYNETLKDNAPYKDVDLSLSGGEENMRYFALFGYKGDQGIYDVSQSDTVSNANFEQYNVRANVDFEVFNIFEGKISVGGRAEDRKYPNYPSSDLWNNLATYPSNIYPIKNETGTWTGTSVYPDNPVASIKERGWVSYHDRNLNASFQLKEKLDFIVDGLYISQGASFNNWQRGTYSKTKEYARYIGEERQTTHENTHYDIYSDNLTNQWDRKQFTASLGYDKQFGLQEVSSAIKYWQSVFELDADMNGAAGVHTTYANANIGGRIHYSYDDRYSAELGFAYAGSDNYAKDNRWGFFPALSVSWIMSNEQFFESYTNIISSLKLRASAGKSGNDRYDGRRYLFQQYYTTTGAYPTSETGAPSWHDVLGVPYIGNPDLFAEISTKYNIGLDVTLMENLDMTLEGFIDKRTDIITQDFSLPAQFGAPPPYRNIGEVTNKGLEASFQYNKVMGDFGYTFGGMALYNINEIDYMAEVITNPDAARTGNPIGTPFGLLSDGFYDVDHFDSEGNLNSELPEPTFGSVQPGDIKYVDRNNDGVIDEFDETIIGDPYTPEWVYSFNVGANFRGFDLNLLFEGVAGRSVNLLDAPNQVRAFVGETTVHEIALDRWAYYPDQGIDTRATADYPRLTTEGNPNNYRNSTFWMKNGDFLRLRNAEIGYSLPVQLTNQLGISNARIFASALNLITWSPLLKDYNIDPEIMHGYPVQKSVMGGITMNF